MDRLQQLIDRVRAEPQAEYDARLKAYLDDKRARRAEPEEIPFSDLDYGQRHQLKLIAEAGDDFDRIDEQEEGGRDE